MRRFVMWGMALLAGCVTTDGPPAKYFQLRQPDGLVAVQIETPSAERCAGGLQGHGFGESAEFPGLLPSCTWTPAPMAFSAVVFWPKTGNTIKIESAAIAECYRFVATLMQTHHSIGAADVRFPCAAVK